jgi:ubiquinone biosynthesis protein
MGTFSSLCRLGAFARVLLPLGFSFDGEKLERALARLGPAAIKLGQVLATRPDIVGGKTAAALSRLQDRLPPFPTPEARRTVEEAFGAKIETLFSEFGEPVAAASIAQVHPAVTAGDGRKVAVKVLRPGIERDFSRDIDAFALVARLAERFSSEARRLRFTAVVGTLKATTAVELDLRMEAAAASEFAGNVEQDAGFRVPAVDWALTAGRVLTTAWIDGVSVRDPAKLAAAGHDPKQIAVALVREFLTTALRDGFFHADLHPGNLFVTADGAVVAVDFGIMGRLDLPTRRFMADVLMGFLKRDYAQVAKAHVAYGVVAADRSVDLLAQTLRAIVEPIFGHPSKDVSLADLLTRLFDTTRKFGMQTQPQLLLLQKTMVVAEGVARTLDPDFDMWEAARPVAENWLREETGPLAKLKEVAEILRALGRFAAEWAKKPRNTSHSDARAI